MRRVHVQSVVPDQCLRFADAAHVSQISATNFRAMLESNAGESNKIVQVGPTRNRLECRPGGRESTKTI